MTSWQPLPVETDEDAVTVRILDGIANRIPGWQPVEGAVEVVLAEEIGREVTATNLRAIDAADTAIAGIGESVHGLIRQQGVAATMRVRLDVPGPGVVVDAGFVVVATATSGEQIAFELAIPVTSAGTTVDVTLQALETGQDANGAGEPLVVQTATDTVSAALVLDAATGGVDLETRDAYLDRLTAYLQILRPGGVRGTDLAVLARNVPGVHRALGLDLYDATTGQSNVERTVTIVPIDDTGQPVSADIAADVQAALEDVREVNFVVRVGTPTYTPITVVFSGIAEQGAVPADVTAAVNAAIRGFLSPAEWARGPGDAPTWEPLATVRYLDLARVAGSAPGLSTLLTLTINGAAADYAMAGPAALPAGPDQPVPSTVTGSIQ